MHRKSVPLARSSSTTCRVSLGSAARALAWGMHVKPCGTGRGMNRITKANAPGTKSWGVWLSGLWLCRSGALPLVARAAGGRKRSVTRLDRHLARLGQITPPRATLDVFSGPDGLLSGFLQDHDLALFLALTQSPVDPRPKNRHYLFVRKQYPPCLDEVGRFLGGRRSCKIGGQLFCPYRYFRAWSTRALHAGRLSPLEVARMGASNALQI